MKQGFNPIYDNDEIRSFVRSLPEIFEKSNDIIFNGRNVIKQFSLNINNVPQVLVVKRFRKPHLIQRFIYSYFRKSKAERAFINGAKLTENGINTPLGIAFLETWEDNLFKSGYYITTYNDWNPIKDELEKKDFNKPLAIAFAEFIAHLHEKGILHHDLNSTNVLYNKLENSQYSFSLIDINRMSFKPSTNKLSQERCFNNLTRFTGNMELYEFVLKHYIECRGWNLDESLKKAISIKIKHDDAWRKRKAFFSHFKSKKQ